MTSGGIMQDDFHSKLLFHILGIHHPIACVFQRLSQNSGTGNQLPREAAVINLIHSTSGASGLEDDTLDVFLSDQLHGLCHSFPHGGIHIVAIAVHEHSSYDLYGGSGTTHTGHHLRADGEHFLILYELCNRRIVIVAAVVFAVFTQQAGADQNYAATEGR